MTNKASEIDLSKTTWISLSKFTCKFKTSHETAFNEIQARLVFRRLVFLRYNITTTRKVKKSVCVFVYTHTHIYIHTSVKPAEIATNFYTFKHSFVVGFFFLINNSIIEPRCPPVCSFGFPRLGLRASLW